MTRVLSILWAGAAALVMGISGCSSNDDVRSSVVRIVARADDRSSTGTGFFVRDEKGRHWVVTNFHVINAGGNVVVERTVNGKGDRAYVEAYPEVRVAKFDANADLAILELRNVPTDKMPPLALGAATQDLQISSWGYPASNLVVKGGLGLTRKDGRVSNLVRFPVIDRVTKKVLQEDAVPALVVSTELEPGFSGGPTVDESGRVVGVNVLKDTEHQAQNGAIDVEVLKTMLQSFDEPTEPSAKDVTALLDRIQNEYLRLPLSQRRETSEVAYVALDDCPKLRAFFSAVDAARRETEKPENGISIAARVGHELASLPGLEFESWLNLMTRAEISQCKKNADQLEDFLGKSAVTAIKEDCMAPAYRMFVWDLVSSTVRWNGKPADYAVSRIETLSRDKYLYKATVSIDEAASFTILLTNVSGELRLKLFDLSGVAYAVKSPDAHVASDFIGLWKSKESSTDGTNEFEDVETVKIRDLSEGLLEIQHSWQRTGVAPPGKIWTCNSSRVYNAWINQYFLGVVNNGQIVPQSRKNPERSGGCVPRYTEDVLVRFEIFRGELIMYRTDGGAWPEIERFRKSG